jgi:hypothetical protein
MQEIAFGHAPFLGSVYWDDIEHAFVESNLVIPVAKSYGVASASSIEYQVDGAWESPSVAARFGAFTRVRATYNNGLIVVANASRDPLRWQEMNLPQYGWVARGHGLLAYTAMCDTTVCDYAETPTSVFANARNQADVGISRAYAMPSVASVQQTSRRSFAMTLNWRVYRSMPHNYKVFVHFVNDDNLTLHEGTVFQGNAALAEPTAQWTLGGVVAEAPVAVQVPSSVADGTYSIRVGLYDPSTGDRVPLAGVYDRDLRYLVGYLRVSGGGSDISFNAVSPVSNPRLNSAGAVVNFGSVQTDGMVSIRENNGHWVLRPFPRSRNFTVLLQNSTFVMPSDIRADGGSAPVLKPVAEGSYWKLPLTGAKSYSWPAANQAE